MFYVKFKDIFMLNLCEKSMRSEFYGKCIYDMVVWNIVEKLDVNFIKKIYMEFIWIFFFVWNLCDVYRLFSINIKIYFWLDRKFCMI